jgi:hypothetical protein
MLGLFVAIAGVLHGLDCDLSNSSVIELKWDMFASETGLYTVEGCEGVSPTLHLNIQQEYRFLQQDTSNWYHPVGFAYGMHLCRACLRVPVRMATSRASGRRHPPRLTVTCFSLLLRSEPGGAHSTCPPDNPEECPELGGNSIQYYFKGEAVTDDESGFGLDAYEPFFFYPMDAWEEGCGAGGCYVTLNVPNANVNTVCSPGQSGSLCLAL